jgi:hypothetical protein
VVVVDLAVVDVDLDVVDVEELDGGAWSFAHVTGPTMPSCVRPLFFWNLMTACCVWGPNWPSIAT